MKDTRPYAYAFFLASLGLLTVAVLHPTGAGLMQDDRAAAESTRFVAVAIHVLGLCSFPILLFAIIGLYRSIADHPALKTAGAGLFFWGGFAVMIAGAISGLVTPELFRELGSGSAVDQDSLRSLLDYSLMLNQAFAGIYLVSSSISLILFSICLRKSGWFFGAIVIAGFIFPALILLAYFAGHLRLDVHGFGIFTFTQVVWFVLVGVYLLRTEAAEIS